MHEWLAHQVLIFKELQSITVEALEKQQLPEKECKALIQKLKDKGLCTQGETCSYVGVVEIKGEAKPYLLCFFPKYYNIDAIDGQNFLKGTSGELDAFKTILKAIHKYQREEKQTSVSEHPLRIQTDFEHENHTGSKLSLAVQLIDDYLQNGLYSNMQSLHRRCGNGEINWQRTVDTTYPLIRNAQPYYMEYWTTERTVNTETLIAKLHEAVVADCSNRLAASGLADLLDLPTPFLGEGVALEEFADERVLLNLIEQEMRVQFVTQKQHLLQLMHHYIQNVVLAQNDSKTFSLFGTSSFHTLWEKVCGRVFGNQLNADIFSGYESRSRWTIDKKDLEAPSKDSEDGTKLRPDFVALNSKADTLYILDAKYYDPDFVNLQRCPGVGDVNKQHLYQMTYHPLIKQNNLQVVNAFLMPKPMIKAETGKISVCCSLFKKAKVLDGDGCAFKIAPIQTALIDPGALFKDYLANLCGGVEHELLSTLKPETVLESEHKRRI